MTNKEKLILLADELDRRGLETEASVVDNTIIKLGFQEEDRQMISGVVDLVDQHIAELVKFVEGEEAVEQESQETISIQLEEAEQRHFKELLERVRSAIGAIGDVNDLSEDEDKEEEEAPPTRVTEPPKTWVPPGLEEEGDKEKEEETTLPNPGNSSRLDEEDDQDEDRETTTLHNPGNSSRRPRRHLEIEQSISNSGNIVIG